METAGLVLPAVRRFWSGSYELAKPTVWVFLVSWLAFAAPVIVGWFR